MEDFSTAKNAAGGDSMGQEQELELDRILNGEYRDVFRAPAYFSVDNKSTGHIFDVIKGDGIMKSNLGGDTLMKMIEVSIVTDTIVLLPILYTSAYRDGSRRISNFWLTIRQDDDQTRSYDLRFMQVLLYSVLVICKKCTSKTQK